MGEREPFLYGLQGNLIERGHLLRIYYQQRIYLAF